MISAVQHHFVSPVKFGTFKHPHSPAPKLNCQPRKRYSQRGERHCRLFDVKKLTSVAMPGIDYFTAQFFQIDSPAEASQNNPLLPVQPNRSPPVTVQSKSKQDAGGQRQHDAEPYAATDVADSALLKDCVINLQFWWLNQLRLMLILFTKPTMNCRPKI